MLFINKGKHIEKEIDGIRVRVVENEASRERKEFLKKLLEHNGYEVLTEENPPKPVPKPPAAEGEEPNVDEEPKVDEEPEMLPPTWVVGVTDIIFNPVVSVYQRNLRTLDGHHVTADYWNQQTSETEPNYWDLSKKKF